MIKKQINPTKQLSKLLENIMVELSYVENDNIIRAVPVAMPIVDASWRVRIKVTTPIGMVERYLLDAVRRFGPITEEELDELMGLGTERINFLITDIINQGAPIALSSKKLTYTDHDKEPLKEFYKIVEQEFSFIFNGITGELLPVRFWKNHEEAEINIFQDNDNAISSRLLHLKAAIINSNIKPCAKHQSSDKRAELGLPAGYMDVTDTVPIREKSSWVIAFIFIYASGKIAIRTAGNPSLDLGFPKESISEYLKNTSGGLRWKDDWLRTDLIMDDFPKVSGVSIKHIKNGLLKVSFEHPGDILSWKHLLNNECEDDSINNIAWNLLHGWDWGTCKSNFLVTKFTPGDNETAKNLLLLRGSWRLQDCSRELPSVEKVTEWWKKWQSDQLQEWGMFVNIIHDSLDQLLQMAQYIQDQEFREYVINLQKKDFPGRKKTNSNEVMYFLKSDFAKTILRDIDNAKKSISIIVPVIDDEHVLRALASARKRGVVIKIITAIKDRSGKKHRFQTTGFDGDRDPANQTEVLRHIAEMDILCRDTQYHPHAKLIAIDDNTAIISSANLNSSSLGLNTGARSIEAGLRFSNGRLASICTQLFNAVWASCPFRQSLRMSVTGHEHTTFDIREEKGESIKQSVFEQKVHGLRLILSVPDVSSCLEKQLTNMINMATQTITMSALSMYETQAIPNIHNALLNALKRKVTIKVCVRPGSENKFSVKNWPDDSTLNLLRHGLLLYEVDRLHAKGIVIDGTRGGLFSGNLNPFSLSDKCSTGHVEIGLFWDNGDDALTEYSQFIEQLPLQGRQLSK